MAGSDEVDVAVSLPDVVVREEPRRDGPAPLEADSWEDEPPPPAPPVRRRRSRLPVVITLTLLVLGAGAALRTFVNTPLGPPFAGASSRDGDSRSPSSSDDPGDVSSTRSDPANGAGATYLPVAPTGTPSSRDRPVNTGGAAGSGSSGSGSTSGGSTASGSSDSGPFMVEAEAGMPQVKLTSTRVEPFGGASGGAVVRFIGSGAITFRSVAIATAATYRIEIRYAHEPALDVRTALVSVDEGAAQLVVFGAGTGCCGSTTVDVSLSVTTHTITIAGGESWTPPIDRITVTRL
jgi:hypothetical protein